jgi:polar amino acid transport system permease protein
MRRPLLVYGVVGLIYFALCYPISLFAHRLERRMARALRSAGSPV